MSKISLETHTDDAYKAYIEQVRKIPLLTVKEELELTRRAVEGDENAIKRLIEANLRLVIKIGRKYVSPGVSFMDIIQEGNFGLMHAIEKFDTSKNARFSTYAVFWIRQYIGRFVASKRRAIRLPLKKEDMLRKISILKYVLNQKLGREPKIDEIAAETGYSVFDIEFVMNISSNPLSLENEFIDNDGSLFAEICEDSRQCNPERDFLIYSSRNETRRFLKRHLSFRERNVILHRFNFVDSEVYTFQKLAVIMGISAEAVRQIEKRALNKIRTKSDELLSCVYA
ncbi:MAG: RNA polymerase sigma factor RpoD/SigA [Spirochaetaceae bacterium]|jgi:RNA polymerase primary sigma factor|nr:RNA polymerase sigma factor RpoD/SigA [Spirochaetaceae bacterium]